MFPIFVSVWTLLEIIVSSLADSNPVELPQTVSFNVLCSELDAVQVNLAPAQTFLANENLPVWIAEQENPTELKPIHSVMEELGPFTVYRDPNTCAAALYFHKKKQFEGTIGHHHIIHELDYNPITKMVEVSDSTVFVSPLEKHENRLAENRKLRIMEAGPITYDPIKSLREYPETVYVEILVMVYHDIVRDLEHDYASVVTYVLTLFNSVDMLYSKIEKPNIKINIAGIIIMKNEYSSPRFQNCFENIRDDKNVETIVLNLDCVSAAFKCALDDYQLPFQSYDIAVFLTRATLFVDEILHAIASIQGISFVPEHNNGYKRSTKDLGIAIISDVENLKRFPTVAHEIAHLLGVPHDGGPLWKSDGTCSAHLMKKDQSMCRKCLQFGGKSPKHFEKFFGTRAACIFHNKPRSLAIPPGPQLFWRRDEQCECYGYRSTHNPRKSLLTCHIMSSPVNCDDTLKCIDEKREIHETNFYMDGTPCGKSQVCWDKQCVPIQRSRRNDANEWNGGHTSTPILLKSNFRWIQRISHTDWGFFLQHH